MPFNYCFIWISLGTIQLNFPNPMKQPAERTASLVRQARLISQKLSKFFPYDPVEFKTYIFQSQKSWLPDLHPYAKTIMRHYIAMNRFRIVKGQESEFEEIWKTRNTYLENEPGFIKFNLLKVQKGKIICSMLPILSGNQKIICGLDQI